MELPAVVLFKSQLFQIFRYPGSASETGFIDVGSSGARFSSETDGAELSAWLDRFWRESLEPVFRSEHPDAAMVAKQPVAVLRLSGRSVSTMIVNTSQDLLLAVVKEGCPHCATFLPVRSIRMTLLCVHDSAAQPLSIHCQQHQLPVPHASYSFVYNANDAPQVFAELAASSSGGIPPLVFATVDVRAKQGFVVPLLQCLGSLWAMSRIGHVQRPP